MARLALFFNVLDEARRLDTRTRRSILRMSRYNTRAMEMDEEEFRRNYRVSKELFLILETDLTPYIKKPTRRSDITIRCKILVALSFFATGSYQRLVGRNFGTTMSQQSVSKAIRDVTKALNSSDILKKYIKFPQTLEERNLVKRKFYEKFHIPGVIGCIDGTHVAIIRPTNNEERYFNRKHYHSRNVQIICDSDLNILNVDASFGGATHDSFIFNQHPIKDYLINIMSSREETVYLLGDSGYALREIMMTPIVNAVAESPEAYYTERHCLARNSVERTIGLLKARWRCLLKHRVLHYDPQTSARIINACCVLHNLCNAYSCPAPDITNDIDIGYNVHGTDNAPSASLRNDDLQRGQAVRQSLVQTLWRNRRQ